ncbi:MAG TPA: ATP-binding protein [Solirubrobacteraceae bacterium]|nr:ATP-binding protein [Solirubrobacteraceae bacterium]
MPETAAGPAQRGAPEHGSIGELPHRLLFERNPLPVMVYEHDTLRILAVSDSAIAGYGYSREEFLQLTLLDLTPPDELDYLRTAMAKVRRHGGFSKQRPRHRCKDGRVIEVETTGDDIEFGGRRCRIVMCEDVTERVRALAEGEAIREELRASLDEHRLLLDRNPQPLVVYDCDTLEIIAASHATSVSLGYTREELLSMTLPELSPPEDRAWMRARLQASATAEPEGLLLARPRRQLTKDGRIVDVEVTSDDLVFRGRRCRAAVCVDVTERRRTSAELAVARDQAVEASNLKSAFLANMSHEIRTPMNGVIGMTEMLLGMDLTADQRECAQYIAGSGEQMLAIINDILDISKIETGRLQLDVTDFDLFETIERSCTAPGMEAAAKGLELRIEIAPELPRHVRGDGRRLHQILLNLIANAVKFTDRGSVTVAVAPTGRQVRFAVTDTGIGIAEGELSKMFDPFTQADASTSRLYGGTGLGLAIARELVELMGGTIGAESAAGAGSTFWFAIDLPPARASAGDPAPAPAAASTSSSWGRRPSVLVADDSPINQLVAQRALERCGCVVETVGDGQAALDALAASHFDAVLMDCNMPGMDGYRATHELRLREGAGARTCVIAMTAQAMDGDRERCLAAGMDDYISKPMRYADLAAKLAHWIPAAAAAKPGA